MLMIKQQIQLLLETGTCHNREIGQNINLNKIKNRNLNKIKKIQNYFFKKDIN